MLVKHARPVKGTREAIGKSNEASVGVIRGTYTPYDGMVERVQRAIASPIDHDFTMRLASCDHQVRPKSPFYHVARFLALKAAKGLFPDNFVDAGELRVFRDSGIVHAATYSDFVSDDNGVVRRHADAMREFAATRFDGKLAELQFVADYDAKERMLNPELETLPKRMMEAGIEPNHPEANYHFSNGKTVLFEISCIDLEKAADAALKNGAKPAMEAIAMIYALLVHMKAKNGLEAQMWFGKTDADRRLMQQYYEDVAVSPPHDTYGLIFNLVSDLGQGSAMKLPDTFIRLGLIQLAREMGPSLIEPGGMAMRWGAPARFQVDSCVIAMMYEGDHEVWEKKARTKP
jgi:hypothetical protein